MNNRKPFPRGYDLARVLLVDENVLSRLTLKTVLEAGGYSVDSAETAAEACSKLDAQQYELVLTDSRMESSSSEIAVLAHARLMEYMPATALVTSYRNSTVSSNAPVLIAPQDLPDLLTKVAELISERAARLVELQLRAALPAFPIH